MKRFSGAALLLMCSVLSPTGLAAENMRFYGTLIEPPACTINSGQSIAVNFGNDVMVTRVDGAYKKTPIVYSLRCDSGGVAPNTLRMMIDGDGAAFDDKVLGTAKTDFGIALLNNGTRLPLKTWLNFDYLTMPKLEAVPVKRAGAKLTSGAFSAGATMKVEYR